MIKSKLILFLVFMPIITLFGQSIEYQKYFEDEYGIVSQSLIYCQDGNYLLSGKIYEGEDANEVNYYVTKIDQLGNVLYNHIYRDTVASHLQSSIESTEGDFYFTGFSYYEDSLKYTTLKTSNSGDSLWMIAHGQGKNNLPHKIIETQDNHLLIVGSTTINGDSRKASMLKLDMNGTTIWEKVIGESTSENIALDVIELSDGNFVTSGWWRNGNSKGYLISTNNEGDVVWEKKLSPSFQEVFTDLELCNDGTILVSGFRETSNYKRSPILFKIDYVGNVIWEMVYENMDIDTWGARITQDDNNNILLLGNVSFEEADRQFLLKLDENGNEIYRNFYGEENSGFAEGISTLEDNSIGILTNTILQNIDTNEYKSAFYFIKLNDGTSSSSKGENPRPIVKISPNPSTSTAILEIEEVNKINKISIINSLGKQVYCKKDNFTNKLIIDLQDFKSGVYWVKILGATGKINSEMLLVQK